MAASEVRSSQTQRERWSGNELVSGWSSMLFQHWPRPHLQHQKDWCCWAPSSDRQKRRALPGGPAAAASSTGTRCGSPPSSGQQGALLQTRAWRRKGRWRRWNEARWRGGWWGGSPCQRRFWWCLERTAGSPSTAHWISLGVRRLLWWVSDRWRCREKHISYSASMLPWCFFSEIQAGLSRLSIHRYCIFHQLNFIIKSEYTYKRSINLQWKLGLGASRWHEDNCCFYS